ncbi:PAS domain S-box protein [Oscillatoria sp. FACHB-1407]|uniref:PAS domain-containing sensor histidine kinase n=1 Tax=Oscillatoria sp. FACHB-1407 TaxID=2692847 RepID=UPI00199B57AC|nr:PAS domain S-box protein [Oscillatoria sp. FACHB-1407]
MLELLTTLLDATSVPPQGYDDRWKTVLVWLQTISDTVIVLAGYSIPLLLLSLRQQQNLPFAKILSLFGVFLATWSTAHILELWTLEYPFSWIVGLVQAGAAGILTYLTWELFRVLPIVASPTHNGSKVTQAAILNAIPDLMVRLSQDGVYLDILESKAIKAFKPMPEILGKRLEDVLPTEIAQTAVQYIRQALTTQEVQVYEYRLDDTDRVQDFEARIVACGTKDVLAIIRDISDRKRSEAERQQTETALTRREAQFRALVQHSSDMIVVVGVDGNRTYVSPSVKAILGYAPEELIGRSAFELIHPEDIPRTQAAFYTAVQQPDAPVKVEIRFQRVDGSWAILECVGSNQLSEPRIAGVVVNCRDVSDRTQAEYEIRQLNEQLERQNRNLEVLVEQRTAELLTFINALPDYIFVVNRDDMRMQFCNDALAQAIGVHSRHEVEGKTIFECFSAEIAAAFAEQNEVVFTTGETLHFQEKYAVVTGTPYLDTFKIPLKRFSGEVYALIGASRDITELVEVRQTLWRQTLELEQTNRELDSFSYSVSHDLRAPLRHIRGFVSALRQQLERGEQVAPKVTHYLNNIDSSTHRMALLIDGLLTLSRVGRHKMERHPVDLRQLVNHAIDLHSPEDDCSIEYQIGNLPTVEGDGTLLQQVFSNLISNAVKFSRDRHPAQIKIGTTVEGAIFIKDNGVGFPMEYANQLFEAFQRLHSQHEFEGTGIGLAIVQRIVQRHSGSIWAESQVNQGATFYFTLNQV